MTMNISLPTEHDLETLPIVDITSPGMWMPSEHNEVDHGLSFHDPIFDPSRIAQTVVQHHEFSQITTTPTLDTGKGTPTKDARMDGDKRRNERMPTRTPGSIEDPTAEPPDLDEDLPFFDAVETLDPDGPRPDAPLSESLAFHLSIDYDKVILASSDVDAFLEQLDYTELRGDNEEFDTFAYASRAAINDQAERYVEYLGYRLVNIVRKTLEKTTQLATTILRFPMRRHVKSGFPHLNRTCLRETVATDTYFANVRAIGGATCAQVFYGLQSHMINVFGMKAESEIPDIYRDFIREEGAPNILCRDNSQTQSGIRTTQLNREFIIGDQFTEPGHPQQNPLSSVPSNS
jgi:hypothetical protein